MCTQRLNLNLIYYQRVGEKIFSFRDKALSGLDNARTSWRSRDNKLINKCWRSKESNSTQK